VDLPDEMVLEEAIRANAKHGKQLTSAEKRHLGPVLYERMPSTNGDRVEEIAFLLAVSKARVYEWTKNKRDKENDEQAQRILDLWLRCWTEDQIGAEVGLDRSTVNKRVCKILEREKFTEVEPTDLQFYDRWNITSCDSRFGAAYPGRIPGQVVENVLWYWTEPGDVVMDPFAGSGTTVDVCKRMGRRHVASDLRPTRLEITQNDALQRMPAVHLPVKLVFLDPPYWTMKDDDYPEGSVSAAGSIDEFLSMMQTVASNSWAALAPGGVCAFYMMPLVRPGGEFYDLPRLCANRFEMVGFTTERLIHGWIGNQHITGAEMARAKENRRLPNKTVLIELRMFRKRA
jgi:hypothetical protein